MLLVADTGPLIALASIGQLTLLHQLYGTVLVPTTVHREVLAGGSRVLGLTAYRQADWLEVVEVGAIDPALLALLDEGEASVIALARQRQADVLLIDEQKARKIARTLYGLKVIGSVRVLLEAKRLGLLPSAKAAITTMRDQGYYLHDTIVEYALREAGETNEES
ncbi:MAG: DUF3368 domain-containing protein [Truepera sp.]|nr:DUF3368 domain-containing protein [Truepera sp.]